MQLLPAGRTDTARSHSRSPSRSRSRSGSHVSEALERTLRAIKAQAHRVHRHLAVLERAMWEEEGEERLLAVSFLDAMRLVAILVGLVSEHKGMSPGEYLSASTSIVEECDRYSKLVASFLKRKLQYNSNTGYNHEKGYGACNWYRVAKSAELAFPRAYLVLAIGHAYLSLDDEQFDRAFSNCSGVCSKKDLLDDMRVCCVAVQEPIKGLSIRQAIFHFIRPFLHIHDQDQWKLSAVETLELLSEEFAVANRLWVRLRFFGADLVDECERSFERKQLENVVATPIRLSSCIKNLTSQMYITVILPTLLQHLVACHDDMAQEFLTKIILQTFPKAFHFQSIELLLDAISSFNMTVDIRKLIQEVIACILDGDKHPPLKDSQQTPLSPEPTLPMSSVFDSLWDRIYGLLVSRLGTLSSEEVVVTCNLLLQHALRLEPFSVTRVERIMDFIHSSAMQCPETESKKVSLMVANSVDLVVELLPDPRFFFEISSLPAILEESLLGRAPASCAMTVVGRLVSDGFSVKGREQNQFLIRLILLIVKQKDNEAEWEGSKGESSTAPLINKARSLESLASDIFDRLLLDGCKDKQEGDFSCEYLGWDICSTITASKAFLAMFIFVPKAIKTWLAEGEKSAEIDEEMTKRLIRELWNAGREEQMTPKLSYSLVEAFPADQKHYLRYYLPDSIPRIIGELWCYCAKCWKDNPDLVYEALVESLLIFEEDTTDHHVQFDLLMTIFEALKVVEHKLEQADLMALVQRLFSYTKRLLTVGEKRMFLAGLLDVCKKLGCRMDQQLAAGVVRASEKLMPDDLAVEGSMETVLQFIRLFVDILVAVGPSHIIGNSTHRLLSWVEQELAQSLATTSENRVRLEEILKDWSQIRMDSIADYTQAVCGDVLQAAGSVAQISLEEQDETRNSLVSVLSTFNPDAAEF